MINFRTLQNFFGLSIRVIGLFVFVGVCTAPQLVFAQKEGKLKVYVTDGPNQPVFGAEVLIKNYKKKYVTGNGGLASIKLPAGKYAVLVRRTAEATVEKEIKITADSTSILNFDFVKDIFTIDTVQIRDNTKKTDRQDDGFMERIPLDTRKVIERPTIKTDIESLIQTMPGVAGSSEFSSQYRVRGGNYDENLIYINDVEIYRPLLVRSGQQEGLGTTNANLAKDVSFSTGGFAPRYGDKLSSVLNITYNTPSEFRGTVELGLLTANLHIEGSSKNKEDSTLAGRFTYLIGARRFSTQYVLNTLDSQGDYRPNFLDWQSLFAYRFKPRHKATLREKTRKNGRVDTLYLPPDRVKLSLLTMVAKNDYIFYPQNRETTFGTVTGAIRLFMAFVGLEQSNYITGQSALILEHSPNLRLNFKHIISAVRSEEAELVSVEGGYRLSDINTNFGSESFNEEVFIRGVGTELREARNFLNVNILSYAHRGEWNLDKNFYHKIGQARSFVSHKLQWGAQLSREWVQDEVKEWAAIDSADFLRVSEYIRTRHYLASYRLQGYLQHSWKPSRSTVLTLGLRGNYWTVNQQFLLSPRLQFVYNAPVSAESKTELQFRLAVGYYRQPPFYRELRAFDGSVNTDVRAQNAIHYIAGMDFVFRIWNRPFKLFTEAYYKQLFDLVPYQIENVRIRYFPQYTAVGYAYGLDAKINGQFIEGIDSWLSVSLLNTKEDVNGDDRGYVRRPADQRLMVSLYFQDEVPRIPSLKVHINLVYASGLPFGPPGVLNNRTALGAPFYNRVDLGINKVFMFKPKHERKNKFGIESLWVGLEVFNLFQRQNTISYQWVTDVYETRFAIPNYLSARLINARVIVRF